MVSEELRHAIENQQHDLLEVLLALPTRSGSTQKNHLGHIGVSALRGFSPERLAATGESLAKKRCRTVARCWPHLKAAVGDSFEEHFDDYVMLTATARVPEDAHEDGYRFVKFMDEHKLSEQLRRRDDVVLELLSFELMHTQYGAPRSLNVLVRRLPECRKFCIGINVFGHNRLVTI